MRKTNLVLGILMTVILHTNSFAQWQNKSFTHQGNTRQYRVYKSPNYNASVPASLVITLHGLGDDMTNFSGIGMNQIADTANIIVVVPQAVSDALAGTAWNSGTGMLGYFPNSSINDVGFINTLLDTIQANYAINPNRVYACGFSMGGFMTNRLAVELNSRFTAFATVSGTFGTGLTSYNPNSPVSIAHFHGTSDGTVPFAGNASGIGADSLVHFWAANNQCNPVPQHISIPDTQSDGYTVDQYIYSGGEDNSSVEFFKVTGADHVWLTPANDISYTKEIWKFFNKHKTKPATAGMNEFDSNAVYEIYPNPASEYLTLKYTGENTNQSVQFSLVDLTGKTVFSSSADFSNGIATIVLPSIDFKKGIYLLKLKNDGNQDFVKRVCIE